MARKAKADPAPLFNPAAIRALAEVILNSNPNDSGHLANIYELARPSATWVPAKILKKAEALGRIQSFVIALQLHTLPKKEQWADSEPEEDIFNRGSILTIHKGFWYPSGSELYANFPRLFYAADMIVLAHAKAEGLRLLRCARPNCKKHYTKERPAWLIADASVKPPRRYCTTSCTHSHRVERIRAG